MLKGNKGEWSEIYVLFKLLSKGKLYNADQKLNRISNLYYPVLAILHRELNKTIRYEPEQEDEGIVRIVDGATGKAVLTIPMADFSYSAERLFDKIKGEKKGTFSHEESEKLLKKLDINKIKSPAAQKEDITLIVHDFRTGIDPQISFSIKSRLGGASTLLNAGKATNFTYKLMYRDDMVAERSELYSAGKDKTKDLVRKILKDGTKLQYEKTDSEVFKANLEMTDSLMPQMIAEILIHYYNGEATAVKELASLVAKSNPLNFVGGERAYLHKISNFLLSAALGMTPASYWDGDFVASGGYIIVREDGEVVCYHVYNIDQFKEYLLNNTKLETPSTTRHGFGEIYTKNGEDKIKLNLQVRFIR